MSESFNSMETVSFRRFLSYIYAYEDERKLRNVGFAKVEIRAPRVRFQIIVNGLMQKGGRPMEICLVDESMRRIPVGQMLLQNGRGEYQGSTALETMWESGLSFSQIYGICLLPAGDRRHYYMTLWREPKPFFRAAEAETGEREDALDGGEDAKAEGAVSGKLGVNLEFAKRGEAGKEVSGEFKLNSELCEREEEEGIQGTLKWQLKNITGQCKGTEGESSGESGLKVEAESCEKKGEGVQREFREQPEAESCEKKGEEVQREFREQPEAESCEKKGEGVQREFRQQPEPEICIKTSEEIQQEVEAASELLRQQEAIVDVIPQNAQRYGRRNRRGTEKVENQMELWKKFCSHYPHVDIRPISLLNRGAEAGLGEKGKLCEVVRIRPNDIGRLPRNNWILAHNSFLQNAYNHFRYLILFRVEYQKETGEHTSRWFLGLPGEKNEQEAMVAKVFGFQKYLSCRHGGFWYTEIFMGAY